MKRFFVVLTVVVPLFLVACTSHVDKAPGGGPDASRRITASGYSEEGCLLNLKLAAREKNVRLVPDDLQVDANILMFIFPFLNHEGYHCSASFIEREKRPLSKDPLYPFE